MSTLNTLTGEDSKPVAYMTSYRHVLVCSRIREIGAEAHTNAFYKHFYYFVKEHNLLEERDYAPLEHLTLRICVE